MEPAGHRFFPFEAHLRYGGVAVAAPVCRIGRVIERDIDRGAAEWQTDLAREPHYTNFQAQGVEQARRRYPMWGKCKIAVLLRREGTGPLRLDNRAHSRPACRTRRD
jgi:hypothetical protein